MLASGNIGLHKVVSNYIAVMEAFPIGPSSRSLPAQHSLGVRWDIQEDRFTFRVSLEDKPFTRRGVLSVVNFLMNLSD